MKLTAPKFWYNSSVIALILLPSSLIYLFAVMLRRLLYRVGIKKVTKFPVRVIVVGNITVGGSGKTPLVIWLANYLTAKGYRPGIVSRGYGGNSESYPVIVSTESRVDAVGDEALLFLRHTNCPIVVSPDRVSAANKLLESSECNIILSDDGLQHYALARDTEIVVVDGERRFGNGFCLPAGPLREPTRRLKRASYVVVNGGEKGAKEFQMRLKPSGVYNLLQPERVLTLADFRDTLVHAVAGIGNNARFFSMLRQNGLEIIKHSFPDHYAYTKQDRIDDGLPILMTEKDMVKWLDFADHNCWYVAVEAEIEEEFARAIV